jgi:uncharacterized repeat protein (TIGR01451 family)
MLFGSAAPLNSTNRLSGPRNPPTNFFSSQILDDEGRLDTAGTFGSLNHTPGEPEAGARQGWDISNVDASAQLRNNQTTAFAQGATSGDGYRITALALQIDVGAPTFQSAGSLSVDRATAMLGDVLTYTTVISSSGTSANNSTFFNTPPMGTSFVADSFTVNGVPRPGANPATGVALGTIPAGATLTITFQVRVDAIPPGPSPNLRSTRARWTFDFVSCAGQPSQAGVFETNTVTTDVPVADLSVTKALLNPPATAGAPVSYQVVVRNNGPSTVNGAGVSDPGTSPALTGVTWSCVATLSGTCPPSGTGPLSAAVGLAPGASATFTVTGTLSPGTPPGTMLTNTATVTTPAGVPDFNLANNAASAASTTAAAANVLVTKAAPPTGQLGTNVTYTVNVLNDGPSDAQDVLVTDLAPSGLTPVSITGACGVAPGCLLPAGVTQTVTVVFAIPPDYAGPDPIVNTATVSSSTPDPVPANNTATATTALDAPVVDLSVTKTNGVIAVTAGLDTTYTITVSNAGPASALATRVVDLFDPAFFANPRWQCDASGTSACQTTGPQTGNIDALVNVNPGAENVVVFTAQVLVRPELAPAAEIANTVAITPPAGVSDATSADNAATDSDTIATAGDVAVTSTGPTTIVPGTTVEYTVVVTNNGPSVAIDIQVPAVVFSLDLVAFPEFLAGFVAPPGIDCPERTAGVDINGEFIAPVCFIPSLPPLASLTFTWRYAIPPDYPGSPDTSTPALMHLTGAFLDQSFDSELGNNLAAIEAVVTPQADVAIIKVGPAAVVAGSLASYFVTVSNSGASTATNLVVEDPIPVGLALVAAEGPCAAGFPCTIPALAPGTGQTTRIDLRVPSDYPAPSTFVTTATVTSGVPDANHANNSTSVSTFVVPNHADVGVTLIFPPSVPSGGVFTGTARVTNFGPGPAFNVTSSSIVTAGATTIGGSVAPGSTCTPPTPGITNLTVCSTPVLEAGQSVEFTRSVRLDSSIVAGSLLSHLVTVSSTTPGHNPDNNLAVAVVRVTDVTEAGVSIEMTDSPDPVVAGSDVIYTLTVRNAGPAAATSVTVIDTLPSELTLVSATPSQGTCNGATCSLGTVAAAATATITLVATSSSAGIFTNTAAVTAAEPDPVLTNNTATEETTVAMAGHADLLIEKIGPTLEAPGKTTFYTITLTNRGPAAAAGVAVSDLLPAGLTFVGNAGACRAPFPCSFDTLAPGQSVVIFTAFTINPGIPTPTAVVNTASVNSFDTVDPNPANNSATVSTAIDAAENADLIVRKVDSPDPVRAGAQLSYGVSVLNRGPGPAADVVLNDVLPAGLTLVSATHTGGSCSGTATITCTIGTMAPGNVVEVGVLVDVSPTATSLDNTVSATTSAPDPDPANNSVAEHTTVLPAIADVQVAITGPPVITRGAVAALTVTITNAGPSATAGVTLDAPTPPGLVLAGITGCPGLPCTLPGLVRDASHVVVVNFTVPAAYAGPSVITLSATIAGGTSDPNPANNTATHVLTVAAAADLSIVKTGPVRVVPGGRVTYALTVRNSGPSSADGVTVSDPTPAGLTFVSNSGDCTTPFPCALGTMAGGTTRTIIATFEVQRSPAAPGPVENTASVTSSTADPTPANNSAMATTHVRARVGCDVDGDGLDEIVTGAGPGGGPHVRVIRLTGMTELAGFYAYHPAFGGGVFVACGDVNGDGLADVVTGAGPGGGPHVRAFSVAGGGVTEIAGFYAYDPRFGGGVRVAVADVNGDGLADVITGAGPFGGPHVRAFSFAGGGVTEIAGFYAYDPTFAGGVLVAGGDVNGDGIAEIITGTTRAGGPVRVFTIAGTGHVAQLTSFFAYFPAFQGPVRVAAADVNGDGLADIITGTGPGGGPHVQAFSLRGAAVTPLASFYAYDPAWCDGPFDDPIVCDGVFVAGGDVTGDGTAEIITGTNRAGGPVRVFQIGPAGVRELANFYPYFPAFRGPVHVGAADLTGDGVAEPDAGRRVRIREARREPVRVPQWPSRADAARGVHPMDVPEPGIVIATGRAPPRVNHASEVGTWVVSAQ